MASLLDKCIYGLVELTGDESFAAIGHLASRRVWYFEAGTRAREPIAWERLNSPVCPKGSPKRSCGKGTLDGLISRKCLGASPRDLADCFCRSGAVGFGGGRGSRRALQAGFARGHRLGRLHLARPARGSGALFRLRGKPAPPSGSRAAAQPRAVSRP